MDPSVTDADSSEPVEETTPPALNPRQLLRRYGLPPSKQHGQRFLMDQRILARIAALADLEPGDHVLEIGAGIGNLTTHLARTGADVLALEVDARLLPLLNDTVGRHPNVRIVEGDALTFPLDGLFEGAPYKVTGNLPYHIASPIIQRFFSARPRPVRMVVMVQREVAERMVASAGEMSLLSLAIQIHGQARIALRVPGSAFRPVPRVESAVVVIDVCLEPLVPPEEEAGFFSVARAGFSQPRKQIHNPLAKALDLPPATVAAALAEGEITPGARAQDLSIEEWKRLYASLKPLLR